MNTRLEWTHYPEDSNIWKKIEKSDQASKKRIEQDSNKDFQDWKESKKLKETLDEGFLKNKTVESVLRTAEVVLPSISPYYTKAYKEYIKTVIKEIISYPEIEKNPKASNDVAKEVESTSSSYARNDLKSGVQGTISIHEAANNRTYRWTGLDLDEVAL